MQLGIIIRLKVIKDATLVPCSAVKQTSKALLGTSYEGQTIMSKTAKQAKADAKRIQAEQKSEKKDKELFLIFLTQMHGLAKDYWQFKALSTSEGNSKAMRAEVEMETLARIAKENIKMAGPKIGNSVDYVKACLKQAEKEVLKSQPRAIYKATPPPPKRKSGVAIFTMLSGWIGLGGALLFLMNFLIHKVFHSQFLGDIHIKESFGGTVNQIYVIAAVLGLGVWCTGKLWIKTVELGK